MFRRTVTIATGTLALAAAPFAALASDGATPDDAAAAVRAIRSTADDIVAGKYAGPRKMQAPARTIALAWLKAEPVYAKNGNVLVETHVLNVAITSLEDDYKGSYPKAQADAKSVSQAAATLLESASASPAPSGAPASPAPSGAPSAAPSGSTPKG